MCMERFCPITVDVCLHSGILYNDEKFSGATVHFMSVYTEDIVICLQISNCKTVFQMIKKTKELGGKLINESIRQILIGIL